MAESYGEVFSEMIDRAAKFEDRPDIFRRLEISRNQFYNVTNPNRTTSGGNSYTFPTEWGVRATREFKDYAWIKLLAKDCGCICLTPDEIKELQENDPEECLKIFQKIIGMAKDQSG